MTNKSKMLRISSDLVEVLNFIMIDCLRRGKNPPSNIELTKRIARQIKRERKIYNDITK